MPPHDDSPAARLRRVAPTLRALLASRDDRLPVLAFDDAEAAMRRAGESADRTMVTVEIPADADDEALRRALAEAIGAFRDRHGESPDEVGVPGLGLFAVGYPDIDASGRVAGKVAVVTGAAQGFGLEIARDLASQGAHVVLGDINVEGARQAATAIEAEHGDGRAMGVAMNVTDRGSVVAALDAVVRRWGGVDVFVSNAGVLRAESVKTQSEKDFRFVTDVNYTGYFVCVQAVAPIMAAQHAAREGAMTDIVQINSKSGLTGSNKNAAYAGSKFGGIGLTQSFALELIDDGIKVNSICPGNFYDGPLWSDPERGLFVQYLRAGKVPGAQTVEDVRRAYEAKSPIHRGCTTPDVMHAIYYLIDQKYETGQAMPVTGGQVMLS
jgi:sorbitol-6-phosphate 2-dehydrogenase